MKIDFPFIGFTDLPVLRVVAGSAKARRKYIEQLMHALQQRSLTSISIKQNKSDRQHRYEVLSLVRQYDLVIIDVEIDMPSQEGLLSPDEDRQAMTPGVDQIIRQMDTLVRRTPVWACILIGGKSSRMGQPKHLLQDAQGITWLERSTEILAPLVDEVVISGAGRLPDKLTDITRLADIPGVAGPMTGIVAASRWQPMVSWLLVACDLPYISTEAIEWLLAHRQSGCWGLVPQFAECTGVEPLLAWYDYRVGQILEEQLAKKNLRISDVAAHPKIDNPVIPEHLRQSWQNINTPDELPAVSVPGED